MSKENKNPEGVAPAENKNAPEKKSAPEQSPEPERVRVRFWSESVNHTIVLPDGEQIPFRDHSLLLSKKSDAEMIKKVRSVRGVTGVYEVIDEPYDKKSPALAKFSGLLRSIVFTGASGEYSRAGVKAVRALFDEHELEELGAEGFNPEQVVLAAISSKSLKRIHNI